MRIGFDIDGVLADFNSSFIALIPEVTGRNLFPKGYWPHTWDYPASMGYTKEETSAVWERIKQGDTFWRGLDPLHDMATLKDWYELTAPLPEGSAFHEFYFITSRMGKNVKLQTEEWLEEFLWPGQTVLISSEKGALCKALQLDYYVDDRAENIMDVELQSPTTKAYLLNQPWNGHIRPKYRINDLSEFLKAIDYHSQYLPAVA